MKLVVAFVFIFCAQQFSRADENSTQVVPAKQVVHFMYAPIADHYAVMLAHHNYASTMKLADFQVQKLTTWEAARKAIEDNVVDLAAIISPLAMKIFEDDGQKVKWIGLAHRDGNALAVNDILANDLQLPESREKRKPDDGFIKAIKKWRAQGKPAPIVGFPDEYATHRLVFLKYLSDQGDQLKVGSFGEQQPALDIVMKAVFPARVLDFLKVESGYGNGVVIEQSLPWAEEIESGKLGKVVWYSKDVMKDPKGHVECVIIAGSKSLQEKRPALTEVMAAVRKAAKHLDRAIHGDGTELRKIAEILHNEYVPAHTVEGIMRALDKKVEAINYRNLNVDKPGLSIIMKLAIKAKLLHGPIDLDKFADTSFDE